MDLMIAMTAIKAQKRAKYGQGQVPERTKGY